MKKLVNGKIIDIKNMRLFELAAEGLVTQRHTMSKISDKIDDSIDISTLKKYLDKYDLFSKYLPYPLHAIERDIKYATFGNFIKQYVDSGTKIWVKDGLNIQLSDENGLVLKFVNNTWGIEVEKDIPDENIDMNLYKDQLGYTEYKWILDKILNKQSTSGYYKVFMNDFLVACEFNSKILKSELENILTLCKIPDKMAFKQNKIYDMNNNEEYSLDIYCNGQTEVEGEDRDRMVFTDSGFELSTSKKRIKTYAFDAYSKLLDDTTNIKCKLSKVKVIGLHNLFLELCAIKTTTESEVFSTFYGVIFGNNLVFTIDKRLFIAKSNRLMIEPIEIANGVELYSIDSNKVYFVKSHKLSKNVTKEIIYSYNLRDNSTRICSTTFK